MTNFISCESNSISIYSNQHMLRPSFAYSINSTTFQKKLNAHNRVQLSFPQIVWAYWRLRKKPGVHPAFHPTASFMVISTLEYALTFRRGGAPF